MACATSLRGSPSPPVAADDAAGCSAAADASCRCRRAVSTCRALRPSSSSSVAAATARPRLRRRASYGDGFDLRDGSGAAAGGGGAGAGAGAAAAAGSASSSPSLSPPPSRRGRRRAESVTAAAAKAVARAAHHASSCSPRRALGGRWRRRWRRPRGCRLRLRRRSGGGGRTRRGCVNSSSLTSSSEAAPPASRRIWRSRARRCRFVSFTPSDALLRMSSRCAAGRLCFASEASTSARPASSALRLSSCAFLRSLDVGIANLLRTLRSQGGGVHRDVATQTHLCSIPRDAARLDRSAVAHSARARPPMCARTRSLGR